MQKDIGPWLKRGQHGIYVNPLQVERPKEAGWLCNSHWSMDLQALSTSMEQQLGFSVGLRWKAIFLGKDVVKGEKEDKKTKKKKKDDAVRAIHVEINSHGFHANMNKLSNTYGKTTTGFKGGRKLRFYPVLNHVKSDYSAAKLRKAIDRQKCFTDVIMEDYTSDFISLDVSYNNLPTMREIIAEIKSEKFPNLCLFHSIDPAWKMMRSRGDFTFLYMPHLAEEARIMMGNLIPYLRWKHSDLVLDYFLETAKADAKDNKWDPVLKRVICATDTNMDEEEEDDGIGLKEAKLFLTAEKAKRIIDTETQDQMERPDPKAQLEKQKEAQAEVATMTNKAEGAYYKDDDSLSTLDTRGTKNTLATGISPYVPASNAPATPATTTITASTEQDSGSVASTLTFESLSKMEKRMDENDEWKKSNDALMAGLLKAIDRIQPPGDTDDNRDSTKTDAVVGSAHSGVS